MRIMIKFPTRGRPEQASRCLKKWLSLLSNKNQVEFYFDTDADDPTLAHETLRPNGILKVQRAFAIPEPPGVSFFERRHNFGPRTKIEAINCGMPNETDSWDILILASDDMWPEAQGYDEIIVQKFESHFPDLDGVLHFNDGYRGKGLNTLPIMGRNYYNRFGYIYHPSYRQSYCDNEFQDVSQALGRSYYFDDVLFRHVHPFNDQSVSVDDTYRRCNQREDQEHDRALYASRKIKAGGSWAPIAHAAPGKGVFGGAQMQNIGAGEGVLGMIKIGQLAIVPMLSVLIATVKSRRGQFCNLMMELARQRMLLPSPAAVQIVALADDATLPVWNKRNMLIAESTGKYVCFVDDDDWISEDYLWAIMKRLDYSQSYFFPDCVVFDGKLFIEGVEDAAINFDIKNKTYSEEGNIRLRPPTHLCPIRREIAEGIGFPPVSTGEEIAFAKAVFPHLKAQEVACDALGRRRTLYHYYYSPYQTLMQKGNLPS